MSDSLFYMNNDSLIVRTDYNKSVNIHNFNSLVSFHKSLLWDLKFDFYNNLNSTILETNPKNIRDLNNFKIRAGKKLTDDIELNLNIKSRYAFDDRNIGLSDMMENLYFLSTSYSVSKDVLLSGNYGFKTEKQIGTNDFGPIYGLYGSVLNYDIENFQINFLGEYNYEKLKERNNSNNLLSFWVNNSFNSNILNQIKINYYYFSRDFYSKMDSVNSNYFSRDLNIERRMDNYLQVIEKLNYAGIFSLFNFEMEAELLFRGIEKSVKYKNLTILNKSIYDEEINEFKFNLITAVELKNSFLNTKVKLWYTERSEEHNAVNISGIPKFLYDLRQQDENQKNNTYSRIQISFENDLKLSRWDKLKLNFNYSIFKYDTPDKNNNDDRDEQFIGSKLTYEKIISHNFKFDFNFEVLLNHLVYIYSERSSSNNWNRVLRFFINSHYCDGNLKTNNSAEVLANYSVYDYEEIISSLRSFSLRQLYLYDSTEIYIYKNIKSIINFGLRFSEQSLLNWEMFSVNPQRYLEEIFSDFKIGIDFRKNFINFGIRLFKLNEYKYIENKKLQKVNSTQSLGPLIETEMILFSGLKLSGRFWLEFIDISGFAEKRNINLLIKINYNY